MTKDELIEHMFAVLKEVEEQDASNWDRLLESGDYQEIDLDKAWHNGYASAISTVRNNL